MAHLEAFGELVTWASGWAAGIRSRLPVPSPAVFSLPLTYLCDATVLGSGSEYLKLYEDTVLHMPMKGTHSRTLHSDVDIHLPDEYTTDMAEREHEKSLQYLKWAQQNKQTYVAHRKAISTQKHWLNGTHDDEAPWLNP